MQLDQLGSQCRLFCPIHPIFAFQPLSPSGTLLLGHLGQDGPHDGLVMVCRTRPVRDCVVGLGGEGGRGTTGRDGCCDRRDRGRGWGNWGCRFLADPVACGDGA